MIDLDSSLTTVVGDKATKRKRMAEGLGLQTVGDLLRHFPRRYVKAGELTTVADLHPGEMLTVVGEIVESDLNTYQDRRTHRPAYRLDTVLETDGPKLRMSFFAKNARIAQWNAARLSVGRRGVFVGQVSTFRNQWQLTNPRMVLFGVAAGEEGEDGGVVDSFGALYPLYPQTKGVDSWDIQRAVSFARSVIDDVPELLPAEVRAEYDVPDARTAIDLIHAPDTWDQVHRAQRRYRFEEALVTQLVLARRRAFLRVLGAQARTGGGGLLAAFDERLPFELTQGQREICAQIEEDLAQPHPMNRLLQGEVGSGKTVVALRAMLRVVDSGGQAALLAPTEVLAQQHYRSITAMLGDLAAGGMLGGSADGTTVALLTGSMPKAARAEAMSRMATGEAGIVIGTHALLEEKVIFADLGLVVVDEQHRFGVEQRAALTDKAGWPPHVLVMTATPIPRTVAMTIFGDLEVSTLTELPAGRAPIQTNVVPLIDQPRWIERVWQRVREEVDAGHQAYVVCPRITGDELEEGERDVIEALEEEFDDTPLARDANERPPLAAVTELVERLRARGPLAGHPGRDAARQDAAGRQGPGDAGLRRGGGRRTGLHHRHRGRRRRRQRDHHGSDGRRPVRHLPAPPDAWPGRSRRLARVVPARHLRPGRHAGPRAARRRGSHHRRLRAQPSRPRSAPRGRRPRQLPVGVPFQPDNPAGAARRGHDRGRARRRDRSARARPGPRRGSRTRRSSGRDGEITAV